MISHWDNRAIALSGRVYRQLLVFYPRNHRADYGPSMAQLFQDQCRDAWSEARGWGLVGLWLRVLPDLMKTSVLEHLSNWKGKKSMADTIAALGRSRSAPMMVFLGVGAAVFLLALVSATIITFLLPESFSSRARIKIEADAAFGGDTNGQPYNVTYDPYFVQTQFEVIQSEVVLSKVIEKLDLNNEWGKRYAGGERLKTSESMGILRSRLDLRPVRNTSLIEICVYSENPSEAAKLANAIADAYQEHRRMQRVNAVESGLAILRDQYAVQDKRIQDAQQEMDHLRAKLNLTDRDAISDGPLPSMDADVVRRLQGELITYETMLAEKRTQLNQLEPLTPEQRRNAISTSFGADAELSSLLAGLTTAEQKLLELRKDYDSGHPTFQNAQLLANDSLRRVDTRIAGIMIGLSNRVAGLEGAANTIRSNLDQAKTNDFAKMSQSRPYYEAKVRVKEMEQFRSILGNQIDAKRTEWRVPDNLVEIVDRAVPGIRPARPNKPLNIFIGACSGVILAVIIGGLAAWLTSLGGRKPRNPATPA